MIRVELTAVHCECPEFLRYVIVTLLHVRSSFSKVTSKQHSV